MEGAVIFAAIRYSFCITPYTPKQLGKLDGIRAVVIKAILGLPKSTATDLLYLTTDHLGMQFRSLIPENATVAANFDALNSHREQGRNVTCYI